MMRNERRVIVDSGLLRVSIPHLDVEYEVWGQAPVQALGTVLGREFYFRARHDCWSFEVADDQGRFPSDGGGVVGFTREGHHDSASYMPLDEACRIIEKCIQELLHPWGA
ncbi:MAG: hypothetical protein L0Z62_06200 [Gemmataceae bacterium]|nr:hypothetical protein [Gemmataceae bacterium]